MFSKMVMDWLVLGRSVFSLGLVLVLIREGVWDDS